MLSQTYIHHPLNQTTLLRILTCHFITTRRRHHHCRLGQQQQAHTICATNSPDLDALLNDIDIPEIEADLATFQSEDGAVFDDNGIALTYRNDGYAIEALEKDAIVTDLSHWGRIRLSGSGAAAFLHGQSTNVFTSLPPGSGCETVLVTAQARCIDLLTCYVQQSGILCLTSPSTKNDILQRLDKHLFPADDVQLSDISSQTAMFVVAGPRSDEILKQLKAADAVIGKPWYSHTVMGVSGKPVIVAVGPLLSAQGYVIIVDESIAPDVWRSITGLGAMPMGSTAWEVARIINGRPAPGKELTKDYNPFEAGLYQAVSVEKGCYVGQETLAKVNNLYAVKQELWGLSLQAPVSAGDEVKKLDGTKLGVVTSAVDVPTGGHRALAYLKCKSGSGRVQLQDIEVDVQGVRGRVVSIPYASRSFPESTTSGGGNSEGVDAAAAEKAAADKAEAEARRQEKLKAMQERLAAWQAQQQQ